MITLKKLKDAVDMLIECGADINLEIARIDPKYKETWHKNAFIPERTLTEIRIQTEFPGDGRLQHAALIEDCGIYIDQG